jgi:hypothetical protein
MVRGIVFSEDAIAAVVLALTATALAVERGDKYVWDVTTPPEALRSIARILSVAVSVAAQQGSAQPATACREGGIGHE